MSPNGLPFGWKSRPAHKFNNAMLRAYNANNISPTGWGDNDEKNSDVKSNSDDVANKDYGYEYGFGSNDEKNSDVKSNSDDEVTDEYDNVSDENDDVADEDYDVAYENDDIADLPWLDDELADENDDKPGMPW